MVADSSMHSGGPHSDADVLPRVPWYFTFGNMVVLLNGQVRLLDDDRGGLPLATSYVVIESASEDKARAAMVEMFGGGLWNGPYRALPDSGAYRSLLGPGVSFVASNLPLCGCGKVSQPHCAGYHVERD